MRGSLMLVGTAWLISTFLALSWQADATRYKEERDQMIKSFEWCMKGKP